eukprot:jgi/Pico_ML_1/54568/g4900.t1
MEGDVVAPVSWCRNQRDPHRHVAHDSERVSKRTWKTRGDERGRADEEGHPGGARAAQGGRIDASFVHGWRGDDGQAKESQERKAARNRENMRRFKKRTTKRNYGPGAAKPEKTAREDSWDSPFLYDADGQRKE